jgi:hopanoid-associated phosphorylase
MRFEAQTAAGLGITCLYGLNAVELEQRLCDLLDSLTSDPPKGLISFGTMGGLAPGIETGQWIVARSVIDPKGYTYPTDPGWSTALLRVCRSARYAPVIGSDRPVLHPEDKRQVNQMTGAYAVDMESHIVARVAKRYNLPFVVARVVLDESHEAVPPIALEGVTPDGNTHVIPVVKALIRQPQALMPLLRLARASMRSRRALDQGRALFGLELGFPHVYEEKL